MKTFVNMNVLITLAVVITLAICGTAGDQRVVLSSNTGNTTETKLDDHASVESVLNKYDGNDTEYTPLMVVLKEIRDLGLLKVSEDLDQFNLSREHEHIIKIQQSACPNIPLCHSNATFEKYELNCCPGRCSCNVPECMAERNCCPDVIITTYRGFPTPAEHQEHCIPMIIDGRSNGGFGYYGVDSCPPGTDEELASRCTRVYTRDSIEHLSDLVPCFDGINQTLYRNKFCAICNGLIEKDLSFFEFSGNFISSWTNFTGTETLLDMVLKEKVCPIRFHNCDHNTGLCYYGVHCTMVVSSCNQLGNWSEYDPDIERACHGFTNYFKSPVLEYHGYFKNIFCYICNGFHVSDINSCQHTSFVRNAQAIESYSVVLRSSTSAREKYVPQVSRHLLI